MARVLLFVTAAVAAAGLAGCGDSSDPLTAVSEAVEMSQSTIFTARVTLTGAAALGAKPRQKLHGSGAFDVRRGLAYERVDLPGPTGADQQPPRDFLVFLPTKIYLAPAAQAALPPGKSVISVPLPRDAAADAIAAQFVVQAMGLSPVLLLDQIAWGATAASKTGSEVVQHVHFTDYRVTVDLRRALARARGPFAHAGRLATKMELAALGSKRPIVHFAVRLDSAGFVRGIETTVPGSKLGSVALELHGYGMTFEPSYPEASAVVPLAEVLTSGAWTPLSPWVLSAS